MKLNTTISLMFNGQCEAAFRVYERCLNGGASAPLPQFRHPRAEHSMAAGVLAILIVNVVRRVQDAQLVRRHIRIDRRQIVTQRPAFGDDE